MTLDVYSDLFDEDLDTIGVAPDSPDQQRAWVNRGQQGPQTHPPYGKKSPYLHRQVRGLGGSGGI